MSDGRMDSLSFELDVKFDEGHSPYYCEIVDYISDDVPWTMEHDIKVQCDPLAEYEEWETGYARYPLMKVDHDLMVDVDINSRHGVRYVSPREIELSSFTAFVNVRDLVKTRGMPLRDDTLYKFLDDVKGILESFIHEQWNQQ